MEKRGEMVQYGCVFFRGSPQNGGFHLGVPLKPPKMGTLKARHTRMDGKGPLPYGEEGGNGLGSPSQMSGKNHKMSGKIGLK